MEISPRSSYSPQQTALLRGPAAHFPAAGGSSSLSSRSHPALCGSCSLAGSPGGSSTRSVIHRNGKFRGKSAQEIIFLFFKIIQQTKKLSFTCSEMMNMVTRKSVMYMQLIYWGCFTSPKHFRISTLQDKQEHDQSQTPLLLGK